MPVDAVPPVGGNPTQRTRSPELKPDDFMKLFTEQLKHQNPTSPMDSTVMLQQMANLAQLNAAKTGEKTLQEVAATVKGSLAQTQMIGAANLIGKKAQIDTKKNLAPMIPGYGISGSVAVPSPATNIKLTIKDSGGKEIYTKDLGPAASAGLMDFAWDGKIDGKEVPGDMYTISAVATVNGVDSAPLRAAGSFKISSRCRRW